MNWKKYESGITNLKPGMLVKTTDDIFCDGNDTFMVGSVNINLGCCDDCNIEDSVILYCDDFTEMIKKLIIGEEIGEDIIEYTEDKNIAITGYSWLLKKLQIEWVMNNKLYKPNEYTEMIKGISARHNITEKQRMAVDIFLLVNWDLMCDAVQGYVTTDTDYESFVFWTVRPVYKEIYNGAGTKWVRDKNIDKDIQVRVEIPTNIDVPVKYFGECNKNPVKSTLSRFLRPTAVEESAELIKAGENNGI